METLSRDLLFDLLLHLQGANLLNLCNSNKQLFNFCNDTNDYFWQNKILLDYSDIPTKPANISWKRYYIQLGTNHLKQIPLYYDEELLGYIWINRDDTPNKIRQTSNQIFKLRYPNDYPISLRNDAEFDSAASIYWKHPLNEYIDSEQPLSREMYNGTSKLTYIPIRRLDQATFERAYNVFRDAANFP